MNIRPVLAVLSLALAAIPTQSIAETKTTGPQATPGIASGKRTTAVFPAEGMTCVSCVGQIKRVLRGMDGVKDVQVDLAKRTVSVDYVEGTVFPELLSAKIAGLGYKVGAPVVAGAK